MQPLIFKMNFLYFLLETFRHFFKLFTADKKNNIVNVTIRAGFRVVGACRPLCGGGLRKEIKMWKFIKNFKMIEKIKIIVFQEFFYLFTTVLFSLFYSQIH